MEAKVWNRLEVIAKMAIELDKAMVDGVTSRHMQVYIVSPGQPFETEVMIDAIDQETVSQVSSNNGPVLCTIELGLYRVAQESAETDSRKLNNRAILSKAKVVRSVGADIGVPSE